MTQYTILGVHDVFKMTDEYGPFIAVDMTASTNGVIERRIIIFMSEKEYDDAIADGAFYR